ncbi:uncharacterized protein METZ01_LOCUS45065, partial [marine metagenome]
VYRGQYSIQFLSAVVQPGDAYDLPPCDTLNQLGDKGQDPLVNQHPFDSPEDGHQKYCDYCSKKSEQGPDYQTRKKQKMLHP